MNLEINILDIMDKLDDLRNKREEALSLSRQIVGRCSVAIKSLHRGDYDSAAEELTAIKEEHARLKKIVMAYPLNLSKYLWTAEQEYAEATFFVAILEERGFLSPEELNIEPLSYVLGMADLIGEVNRLCLNKIREGKIENLEKYLDQMQDVHDSLFLLDYPKGITRNLRPKLDAMRRVLEKLRSDISLAIYMDRITNKSNS